MSLKNISKTIFFLCNKSDFFHTMQVNGDQGTDKARFLLNKDFTFSPHKMITLLEKTSWTT